MLNFSPLRGKITYTFINIYFMFLFTMILNICDQVLEGKDVGTTPPPVQILHATTPVCMVDTNVLILKLAGLSLIKIYLSSS